MFDMKKSEARESEVLPLNDENMIKNPYTDSKKSSRAGSRYVITVDCRKTYLCIKSQPFS